MASCTDEPTIEYVKVVPDLPADLRTPVTVPSRRVETLGDVGVVVADYAEALDEANGKIEAVDCIWTAADADTSPQGCVLTDDEES